MTTEYTPNEKNKKLYSIGASIGGDVGYRIDKRPTFRKTLEGDFTSLSTTTPTYKMSFGIGFVYNKSGSGLTLGPSMGLLIDMTESTLQQSISLSSEEAKKSHPNDEVFWSISKIDYDKKTNQFISTVTVSDLEFNHTNTGIAVYSADKIRWESREYRKQAETIEKSSLKK